MTFTERIQQLRDEISELPEKTRALSIAVTKLDEARLQMEEELKPAVKEAARK